MAGSPSDDAHTVDVRVLRLDPELPVPSYAHAGDAGADLHARHDLVLGPGERGTVATGIALALPQGYAAFVHPRSGLAARHGVTVLNGPGTVDAGYRGEVVVALVNTDLHRAVTLHRGDRVAQLVVQRVSTARFVETDALPGSGRGAGGYGSTGGLAHDESASHRRTEQDDVEEDS
ncbi:dUTP diphosphatase [Thalassiella azotivora]